MFDTQLCSRATMTQRGKEGHKISKQISCRSEDILNVIHPASVTGCPQDKQRRVIGDRALLVWPPLCPPSSFHPSLISATLSAAGKDCTDQSVNRTNRGPSYPARDLYRNTSGSNVGSNREVCKEVYPTVCSQQTYDYLNYLFKTSRGERY